MWAILFLLRFCGFLSARLAMVWIATYEAYKNTISINRRCIIFNMVYRQLIEPKRVKIDRLGSSHR
jgi:hypothetical protein